MRHPLDLLPSYASLLLALSHGIKPDYDYSTEYPEWWDWFLRKTTPTLQRYFEILIRDCIREKKSPLYIVRYEDLVSDPKQTLMGLMSYLLEVEDLSGTNVERRIDHVVSQGKAAATTYKLKATTGVFNAHTSKFTPEQVSFIQETMGSQLYYFGYASYNDNPTGFFEFPEHTPENTALYYKFRADNAQTVREIINGERSTNNIYTHNVDGSFLGFD